MRPLPKSTTSFVYFVSQTVLWWLVNRTGALTACVFRVLKEGRRAGVKSRRVTAMEMRGIDRHFLLDRIGRELQRRMTYEDIDRYLKGFGVDIRPKQTGYGSKWVYAKEL